MDMLDWALEQIWPLTFSAVLAVYLFVQVRLADKEPSAPPEKPDSLAGYDVEWCPGCSVWVPAKTPYCSVCGCPRPHRSL